jgi:hypothetical protein
MGALANQNGLVKCQNKKKTSFQQAVSVKWGFISRRKELNYVEKNM